MSNNNCAENIRKTLYKIQCTNLYKRKYVVNVSLHKWIARLFSKRIRRFTSALPGKWLEDIFSFWRSPRGTWHCVAGNTRLCRVEHDTVSRATWDCVAWNMSLCRMEHDNVSRATWDCVAWNMTMCRVEHYTVSRATWHCVVGNMTLCPGQHDTVSRGTWHCVAGNMTLCRVEHDARACCSWMQDLYILIEHNQYTTPICTDSLFIITF